MVLELLSLSGVAEQLKASGAKLENGLLSEPLKMPMNPSQRDSCEQRTAQFCDVLAAEWRVRSLLLESLDRRNKLVAQLQSRVIHSGTSSQRINGVFIARQTQEAEVLR